MHTQNSKKLRVYKVGNPSSDPQKWFLSGLEQALRKEWDVNRQRIPHRNTDLAINIVDYEHPRAILLRRLPNRWTTVLTIAYDPLNPEARLEKMSQQTREDLNSTGWLSRADPPLAVGYPLLADNFCPMAILLTWDQESTIVVYLITLDEGHPKVRLADFKSDQAFFEELLKRLTSHITVHFRIQNIWKPDLPQTLWGGTRGTQQLVDVSKWAHDEGLTPPSFPMAYMKFIRRKAAYFLFKILGLSYGCWSIRETHPDAPEGSFWMTASGIPKHLVKLVGEHILLVTGVTDEKVVVSIPPGGKKHRVSVEALGHWGIYQRYPEVGAILHLHAWPASPDAKNTPYEHHPCGSLGANECDLRLLDQVDDPGNAVIALTNHGCFCTGENLVQIKEQISNNDIKLQFPVPQF